MPQDTLWTCIIIAEILDRIIGPLDVLEHEARGRRNRTRHTGRKADDQHDLLLIAEFGSKQAAHVSRQPNALQRPHLSRRANASPA